MHFCKDYNFALFKFDTVGSELRPEKKEEFVKTMIECREYTPDLILLNHRCTLGDAQKYATTFLWEGMETYVDVCTANRVTAPHNRAYMFFRGHTPDLARLTEDHGTCISSAIDYFEDDLVYQAFNRSLILAPEVYGSPWLMRDDELALLARIYNLHRRHQNILVNGMLPEKDLGNNAVIRGDNQRRFLATGNASWKEKTVTLSLNEEIGLKKCKKVVVTRRFPTERFIGTYAYGEKISLALPAFRACLFEICDASVADKQLTNCEYTVLHETNGVIDKVNLLRTNGEVCLYNPKTDASEGLDATIGVFDISLQNPVYCGSITESADLEKAEYLYEKSCFSADNDSLEKRSLRRSGKTDIPQVQRARDAFFNQETYTIRGLDGDIPFDGNPDTMYDAISRTSYELYGGRGSRIEGGCLRVDFGATIDADRIEIEYFDAYEKDADTFLEQEVKDNAEISERLEDWRKAPLQGVVDLREENPRTLVFWFHWVTNTKGRRKKVTYQTQGNFRYLRMEEPIDHIYTIKAFKGDKEINLTNAKASNLFAHYDKKTPKERKVGKFTFDTLPMHPYIAVACEGVTGAENVYCVAKVDGETYGFPFRAPNYPMNPWETGLYRTDGYYTFYLPVDKNWLGKEIEISVMFVENSVPLDVYLCDGKEKRIGKMIDVRLD